MSYGNIYNVLETGNKRMDRQGTEMKCQNEGEYSTLNDFRSNRQQPLRSTGYTSTKIRCYRSVTVCLVLLCVLLLTAVIVLCVLINTNNQQFNIKTKNIIEERDELMAKNKNITKQSEQLNQEKKELRTRFNDGWIQYRFSMYLISSEKKSWSDSRRYCKERGADLIIINNKEEQDFVNKISGRENIWIGLSDSDEEGRWKWVDNSTLTTSFWGPGEPDGQRRENCALKHSSVWADFQCSNAYKCICEKQTF